MDSPDAMCAASGPRRAAARPAPAIGWPHGRGVLRAARLLGVSLLLTACTSVHTGREQIPAYHTPAGATGRIARQLRTVPEGDSAVRLLSSGFQAWEDRLRLTQLADHSLDLQYFSWALDETGLTLLSHVVDAAARGVRVRLLLDDMMAIQHEELAKLDAHPNIQVRLFNPFSTQRFNVLIRPFEWLLKDRLNVRMHNKLFIADGLVGIVGGRNIENRYFWLDREFNHRDLDALVAGPVVSAMQSSFDAYWNSPWAIPMDRLETAPKPGQAERYYRALRQYRRRPEVAGLLAGARLAPLEQYRTDRGLQSTRLEFIADPPRKVIDRQARHFERLDQVVRERARQRLLVGMAYVVPTEAVITQVRTLRERGVAISVLTNSMISIDFPAAFSGYAASREELLDLGIALHEYAPDARYDECGTNCATTHMSFHSKYIVIDDAISYVGTMNYDPRSIDLNVEAGLIIYDERVTGQIAGLFHADTRTRNSWQVSRSSPMRWSRLLPDGSNEVLTREPMANLLHKLEVRIWRALPLADEY